MNKKKTTSEGAVDLGDYVKRCLR